MRGTPGTLSESPWTTHNACSATNGRGGDPDGAGSGGISPGLDLNGCGSAGWLVDFLRDPGAKRFCGKKNVMPSFDAERLPEAELKILVPWMRGEWQGKKGVEAHPATP